MRRLLIAGVVGLLGLVAILEGLRFSAGRRGVEAVALPTGSEIEARSTGADYIDAYRIQLPASTVTLDELLPPGEVQVALTEQEEVREGRAPGLRFLASYHLESTEDADVVTLSTVVFYESAVGSLYFAAVKPVHRRIVPFALSRLGGAEERGGDSLPAMEEED